MTHAIESRFARDPFKAVEVLEDTRGACLTCVNSRATYAEAWCEAQRVNGGVPVSRIPFPRSGPGCPCFIRRPDL